MQVLTPGITAQFTHDFVKSEHTFAGGTVLITFSPLPDFVVCKRSPTHVLFVNLVTFFGGIFLSRLTKFSSNSFSTGSQLRENFFSELFVCRNNEDLQ